MHAVLPRVTLPHLLRMYAIFERTVVGHRHGNLLALLIGVNTQALGMDLVL